MLPDRVSNPGPLTYESGTLPIALRGPAPSPKEGIIQHYIMMMPGLQTSVPFAHQQSGVVKFATIGTTSRS